MGEKDFAKTFKLNPVHPGEKVEATVILHNLSDRPITTLSSKVA